jgi:hypothetical protein
VEKQINNANGLDPALDAAGGLMHRFSAEAGMLPPHRPEKPSLQNSDALYPRGAADLFVIVPIAAVGGPAEQSWQCAPYRQAHICLGV